MNELKILVFLHILAASIWAGGYIILSVSILPKSLRQKSKDLLLNFHKSFLTLGMIALAFQILTGFRLATILLPMSKWADFGKPIALGINTKFLLLILTIIATFIEGKLAYKSNNLKFIATMIIVVTILSLLFIYTGISIRMGS